MRIAERTIEAGWGHHQRVPVRVYDEDEVQKSRVAYARSMLTGVIQKVKDGRERPWPVSILELGCGTGDISGPFSDTCTVRGIDVATHQIQAARKRFPKANWIMGPAEYYASGPWDVLVMCEFLEHVHEPDKLVKKWLALADCAMISHPIDEAPTSQLSGGDHCWSYSLDDFKNWFKIGGHELEQFTTFQMGAYEVALGWSSKLKKEKTHD